MENQKHIMAYYPLFEHMKNEHGLTLLESELQEIIRLSDIVKQKYNEASEVKPDSDTSGGLHLACVMARLSLKEIETMVQLLHSADWEYGNSDKRCEELKEKTRNKIGYSKSDLAAL